jgi:asparagine synthase (glutamine-hydrolysing)
MPIPVQFLLSISPVPQFSGPRILPPTSTETAEGWQFWFMGEPLPSGPGTLTTLAETLAGNPRHPTAINGHCLVLAHDPHVKQWHLWTNRFATQHAYVGQGANGQIVIGTNFHAVAKAVSATRWDWPGITGFCGFGFFPEELTWFQEVRILPPATHLVWNEQGQELTRERYWQWRHAPDTGRAFDATVTEFGDRFHAVMDDAFRAATAGGGRLAIPVSGGLDSRSTVAALHCLEKTRSADAERLWLYTYGYGSDSVETRIAKQVAAAAGLPCASFDIPPYLFARKRQILEAVEGFQDITQCRQAAIQDTLAAQASHIVCAHWGDVWHDAMGWHGGVDDADMVAKLCLKKMRKPGRQWLVDQFCQPHLASGTAPDSLFQTWVEKGLRQLNHLHDPDFRIKAFKADHWSFRWTLASIRMFAAAATPVLPFYDNRLADFFCTVPTAYVADRRMQIAYLLRYAPKIARVPWQETGCGLQWSRRAAARLTLPRRILDKSLRMAGLKQVRQRNWEVQFFSPDGRQNLRTSLLDPGQPLHQFIAPREIETLLAGFFNAPDRENGYAVSMLLTIAESMGYHHTADKDKKVI